MLFGHALRFGLCGYQEASEGDLEHFMVKRKELVPDSYQPREALLLMRLHATRANHLGRQLKGDFARTTES